MDIELESPRKRFLHRLTGSLVITFGLLAAVLAIQVLRLP